MSQNTTSNTNSIESTSCDSTNALASKTAATAELDLACVNLISQLEMQIESARNRSNHIEKACENADEVLNLLLQFCEDHLTGDRFENAIKSIENASYASLAHKEVLDTRSWGFAIKSLLGNAAANDPSVLQTYQNLGKAVSVACVSVLNQFADLAGVGSDRAKTIQQSAAVFVDELNANW